VVKKLISAGRDRRRVQPASPAASWRGWSAAACFGRVGPWRVGQVAALGDGPSSRCSTIRRWPIR
jgi:hypothetical protein